MKVVILSAFYEPFMSGAEQLVKQLLEKLDQSHNLVLITARFDRRLPRFEQRSTFVIHRVGIGHKKLDKFLYPLLAAWRVRKLKPRVVHAIMESYAGGALVLIRYLYPAAKRLLTLQSGDLDDERKQAQFWLRLFWQAIHFAPHQITAISNFLANRARDLGVPPNRVSVIPNGVDLTAVPLGVVQEPWRVVSVARLSWEKGLEDLIKGWSLVVQDFPQAQLLIVGEGPERSKLEKLIKSKNLTGKISLLGQLDHHGTLEILASASVFVCPSLAEGLGIVFIEAQACGVPAIGTRVGGIPDIIEDGISGLLIPPHDPKALAAAIKKLFNNPELAERLKLRARERLERYSWPKIVDQFAELYNKL